MKLYYGFLIFFASSFFFYVAENDWENRSGSDGGYSGMDLQGNKASPAEKVKLC